MKKIIHNPILYLFFLLITISSYSQLPSEENNARLSRQIEENNKRLEILRTEDSLQKKLIEQSGNVDAASITPENVAAVTFDKEYGNLGDPNLNQDMSQLPKGENADEIDRSSISKLIDSMPSGFIYFFLGIISILLIKFLFKERD